jgi:hypothetical protein
MDRGIRATWYDLEAEGRGEYLDWLHRVPLPARLARPGYLWAAHVENVVSAGREARNHDPSEWTRQTIGRRVHAPHSPTIGVRTWPAPLAPPGG